MKAKLPRRESERRNHPLARHVDILAAIETRLSLLSMTFMKYIDMGLCCFIPGKVCYICVSIDVHTVRYISSFSDDLSSEAVLPTFNNITSNNI